MIVCLCSNVDTEEIKECAQDGCSFEEMKTKLRVSQCCGCCEQEAQHLYEEFSNAT